MKKIKAINVRTMTLSELSGFGREILELSETSLLVTEQVILEDYRSAFNALNAALTACGEKFGQAIFDADHEADQAYSYVNSILQINATHFKTERVEAAKACLEVFARYDNPTRLPYSQEYGILHNLLADMEALPASTLQLAQIDEWLSELRRRYEVVVGLMADKVQAKAQAECGAVKAARSSFEDSYHTFVDKVYAMSLLHNDANHTSLIDQINALIDDKRAAKKAGATVAAKKKAVEE